MRRSETAASAFSKFNVYLAHEIATPLHGMLVSADVITKYFEANPRAMAELEDLPRYLRNEIKRLIGLLDEIRTSHVLADVNLQPTCLATEVREELALQAGYYHQRRIRIDQFVRFDLPRIMADRDKLRQVLLNLWENAAEAMPHGGTLTLRSYTNEQWVCLEVADTGDGIPAGMPIFDRHVTNKPGGSGLGLAIVREIVQQHDGKVSYVSEPGNGTTFHLEFPALAA
jgi:two-component system sensor histidine kinase HydH